MCEPSTFPSSLSSVRAIRILRLRRNLGYVADNGLINMHKTNGNSSLVAMSNHAHTAAKLTAAASEHLIQCIRASP